MNPYQDKQDWSLNVTLWYFLVVATAALFLQYRWQRRFLYKFSKNVPGPKGWPLIGNAWEFLSESENIFNNLMKLFNSFPILAKAWYGPVLVYGISKPEYLEKVLTSPKALEKMYFYKYASPAVGNGLFTAPVDIWKRHRRIISPAFNQKVLDRFVEIFARHSEQMCLRFKEWANKGEFDCFHIVGESILHITCEAAMGVDLNNEPADVDFGSWVDKFCEFAFLRTYRILYHFDFIFKWTNLYKEQQRLVNNIHTYTDNIIKRKHAAPSCSEERKAFLDLLMDEKKFTDEELRDEVNMFLLAGTDTSSAMLGFIFLMLGMHPEIQKKVYDEAIDVLGLGPIHAPDLPNLTYTERVIKEVMRVFPLAPFIARYSQEDIVLEDNVVIPKGASLVLGLMHVHRDPTIWANPLKFDPDRFLKEEVDKRHPFSYLPFAAGPRNCIGMKYAMMSMKTIVATAVRKIEFSTSFKRVEDVELKIHFMLRPVDGYKISVKLR